MILSYNFYMKEITLSAIVSNVEKVTSLINEELERVGCPISIQSQIDIAIDELFSNIANYAYNPNIGDATIKYDVTSDGHSATIVFVDSGKPYNPLKKDDPNVKADINDRGIGGLGIFMVKKSMDDITYEYKDNKNILTIKKHF